jgi:hypothetical protein
MRTHHQSVRNAAALLGFVLASPAASAAQLVTPTSHWGGIVLPDLEDRAEYGVHFVGFTQFGKEIDPLTKRFTFTPYNDLDQTLGFNILSYSRTNTTAGRHLGDTGRNVDPGPLTRRTTFVLGVIDDRIPRALQNEVIHRSRFTTKLRPVPRSRTDDTTDVSLGRQDILPPVAGWSEEFFLRLFVTRRADGDEQRVATPLFVGGGWQVGTVNQELFVHVGSSVYDIELPERARLFGVHLHSVGVGGVGRAGLLKPGRHLRDLTSHYANVQGLARANVEIRGFETQVEFALTSTTGFFVAPRTPTERALIAELQKEDEPESVYQAKSSMSELFGAFRVRIGDFTFETYNDTWGGKDKGPSFGAHITYNVYTPGKRFPWIGPWSSPKTSSTASQVRKGADNAQ